MRFSYNLSSEIPELFNVLSSTSMPIPTSNYFTVSEFSTKSNDKYRIARYNKDILTNDLIPIYGLLRSVIFNKYNQVVSFAPPKSSLADQFITKFVTKTDNIIAQEFVEGTMINVFYDSNVLTWKISTRNTVDAEVYFYKKENGKTFNAMFFEACEQNNFNLEMLNKKFCYSFVLQHPENRIVIPFQSPQLYLVEAYEIINAENVIIPQNINEIRTSGELINTNIRFPEVYDFSTYSELIEKFASANTPYNIMGIVIKNTLTNERTKIRNPIYEEVRHLKGNQTKTQYQYLHLRKEGKLPEYLKYYPESKKEFSECREKVHIFTNALHQNYLACYVRKEKPLKDYGSQFRTHMFNIHQQFINDLRPNNLFITNTIVQKYVNNLHPSLLMHSLNYNLRKQNVDIIKADASNNV
jgi:hypothetical protein